MGANTGVTYPIPVVTGQAAPYSAANPLGQKTWTQYFSASNSTSNTGTYGNAVYSNIIYGGGYYAFVDYYGYVYYSTDAKTWNVQRIGNNLGLNQIAYGNNIWVIVGGNSNIVYSGTPGGTWTARTSQMTGTANILDVKWISGLNLFILCGRPSASPSNSISSSPDGINWTNRYSNGSGNYAFSNIAYDGVNTLFISSVTSGQEVYSTNGTSWTKYTSNTSYGGYYSVFIKGALNRFANAADNLTQTAASIGTAWDTNPIYFDSLKNSTAFANPGGSVTNAGYRQSEFNYDSVNNYAYQFSNTTLYSSTIYGQVYQLITYDTSRLQTEEFVTGSYTYYSYPIVKTEQIPVNLTFGSSVYTGDGAQAYGYANGVHILVANVRSNTRVIYTTA